MEHLGNQEELRGDAPVVCQKQDDLQAAERTEANPSDYRIESIARETLLAQLQQEAPKQRRRRRILMSISYVVTSLLLLISMLSFTGYWKDGASIRLLLITFSLFAIRGANRAAKRLGEAAQGVIRFEDIRAVGPLAETLELPDRDVSGQAASALIPLLPRLHATDAGLLNAEQRACLHRAFHRKNRELSLSILKAFEQVGDSTDLPFVEQLAEGKGRAARDKRIRTAAIACLPFIRERVAKERDRKTLLRPARAPDNPAETLLRPAQSVGEADPNVLLRPAAPEE